MVGIMSILKAAAEEPPETVQDFNVERYMGTWYEIASFPSWFQKGCSNVRATYTLDAAKKKVHVRNECTYYLGRRIKIEGTAVVVGPGKLQVSFPWQPLWRLFGNSTAPDGNYWVLATDYVNYALVGNRQRTHLWMLSRRPRCYMTADEYDNMIEIVQQRGFDASRIVQTPDDTPEIQ